MTIATQGDSVRYSKGGTTTESANIVKTLARGFSASATWTPAAAAYGAGDVMSVAQAFALVDANGIAFAGGELMIRSIVFEVDTTALQASEAAYALKLYNVTPPSAHADNAAWDLPSGDRAAYIGSIAIVAPTDVGSTLLTETDGINKQITVASTGTIYGELVTVAGFTATAVARKITIHAEAI